MARSGAEEALDDALMLLGLGATKVLRRAGPSHCADLLAFLEAAVEQARSQGNSLLAERMQELVAQVRYWSDPAEPHPMDEAATPDSP